MTQNERRRIAELDLQKARYEATLAERRYAACDPDNRLIAAQLEKNWEAALRRVEDCEARGAPVPAPAAAVPNFAGLAEDLEAAWHAPAVTTRTRQRLLRALIVDIMADVDEAAREVILTIHWRGGQHSQVRLTKPKSGEHGCRTPEEAMAVIRSMASRWSDADIAASLNRMGMRSGQGKSWTAHRVGSLRRVHGIHAYRSAEKDGEWLTQYEAAAALSISRHRLRRLIDGGLLAAEQVVPGAPYQIRASDLKDERASPPSGGKDTRAAPIQTINSQCFQALEEEGHNERIVALGRKAWLFCGSDRGGQRAAAIYSLIVTARMNDIDPQAWLADVLARINDLPQTRLHELLPWEWKRLHETTTAI